MFKRIQIDGKWYSSFKYKTTKKGAQVEAEGIRKRGKLARVIKETFNNGKPYYVIYTRDK